jgi:hypothetical protein
MRNACRLLVVNLKGENRLEDLELDRRIILKLIITHRIEGVD